MKAGDVLKIDPDWNFSYIFPLLTSFLSMFKNKSEKNSLNEKIIHYTSIMQ